MNNFDIIDLLKNQMHPTNFFWLSDNSLQDILIKNFKLLNNEVHTFDYLEGLDAFELDNKTMIHNNLIIKNYVPKHVSSDFKLTREYINSYHFAQSLKISCLNNNCKTIILSEKQTIHPEFMDNIIKAELENNYIKFKLIKSRNIAYVQKPLISRVSLDPDGLFTHKIHSIF